MIIGVLIAVNGVEMKYVMRCIEKEPIVIRPDCILTYRGYECLYGNTNYPDVWFDLNTVFSLRQERSKGFPKIIYEIEEKEQVK